MTDRFDESSAPDADQAGGSAGPVSGQGPRPSSAPGAAAGAPAGPDPDGAPALASPVEDLAEEPPDEDPAAGDDEGTAVAAARRGRRRRGGRRRDDRSRPRHLAVTPEDVRRQRIKSTVEWIAVIVGALVVALVVRTFLIQAFYIPSASMEPTLKEGDRVLVNKVSYDVGDISRGDIVVFELPPDQVGPDGIKDLIKRVIALPGETIETRDGEVYIDGRRLEEPYLAEGMITGDPASGNNPEIARQTVPEGTVFVMGDNRANSHDSRYPDRGPIPIDSIVGRAFVIVWPIGSIGGL